MLRASATRALRQCGSKKRNHHDSLRSPSCAIRRASFHPSPSPVAVVEKQARCFSSLNSSVASALSDPPLRPHDRYRPLIELSDAYLLRIGDVAAAASTQRQRPLQLQFTNFDQRRLFSTNAAKKSVTPPLTPASATAVTSLDDEITASKVDEKETKERVDSTAESATKSSSDTDTASNSRTSATNTDERYISTAATTEKSIVQKSTDFLLAVLKTTIAFLVKLPGVIWHYLTHPAELRAKLTELKGHAIKEAEHFWMGCKLLAADVRTARHILGRTLRGSTLSRRERKQLLRTVTDVFRLVPMSIFVLVPFMEFALPFALKLFPNMLPSTFQDSLKEEEKMKRELQTRISMAGFFQDTLAELAKEQKKDAQLRKNHADEASDTESIKIAKREASSASSFLEFLKKARTGEAIPPDIIIKFANNFEDNLTLDNMGRMQLINLCKYMGILPYGSNDLLRFYLRHKIRVLKDDDQRITWEGIDSLTKMELREACRERGMRSTGLGKGAYKAALQQWLDLSVHKNVPISLLIMSRAFYLHDEMVGGDSGETGVDDGSKAVAGLADVMSGIDKEVLNEIVFEMASSEEKKTNADIRKIQMEVLEHQNELIKEEQEERDAAAKEKEEKQKEKEKTATKVDEQQKQQAEAVEASSVGDESTVIKEEPMEDKTTSSSKDDVGTPMKDSISASTTDFDSLESPNSQDEIEKKAASNEEAKTTSEDEPELSTEEIDAISQLTSPDPVQKEREELQRIKDAIGGVEELPPESAGVKQQPSGAVDDGEVRKQTADATLEMSSAISPTGQIYTEEAREEAVKTIKELEDAVEKEAKESTIISMDGDVEGKKAEEEEEEEVGDAKLQKAIDRLKSRVESMVGKIETQLTDVERKIGNKFHLLDKDGDGVLTMEEMAQVLQTVLRRELTSEEAKAIASDMDADEDGVFSMAELAQWCETNTIVKLAEDGREKDLDDMITERVQERRKLKEEDEEWTGM